MGTCRCDRQCVSARASRHRRQRDRRGSGRDHRRAHLGVGVRDQYCAGVRRTFALGSGISADGASERVEPWRVALVGPDRAPGARVSTPVVDGEVVTISTDAATITFVTAGADPVTTRVGDQEVVTTGPFHIAEFSGLDPGSSYDLEIEGLAAPTEQLPASLRTLVRPSGALVATIARSTTCTSARRSAG